MFQLVEYNVEVPALGKSFMNCGVASAESLFQSCEKSMNEWIREDVDGPIPNLIGLPKI